MKIFDKIFRREELVQKPLVMLDIGASGSILEDWKLIAKHAICFAFDADDREIEYLESETKGFKRLIVVNKIVSANHEDEEKFYLTRNPYCSSLLEPNVQKLDGWAFDSLFDIEEVKNMQSVRLPDVFGKFNIDYVDWFKTDSQGTDLRLFKSLGDTIISRMIIAEFEPGIIDAYIGEDKLHALIHAMDSEDFWMADIQIKGSQKISKEARKILADGFVGWMGRLLKKPMINHVIKTSPGWGEVSYLNKFSNQSLDKRDYLVGWVISTIKQQHGFALDLTLKGQQLFDDEIFLEMKKHTLHTIKMRALSMPFRYISFRYRGKL